MLTFHGAGLHPQRYASCILRLEQLTPHQKERLHIMLQADEEQSLHIKAAAGTGKTFVAMIFLQKTIDAIVASKDTKRRVLIVAPNEPLVLMIVKWLAQRCVRNRQMKRLLKTKIFLLFIGHPLTPAAGGFAAASSSPSDLSKSSDNPRTHYYVRLLRQGKGHD